MMLERVLVSGASGPIGTALVSSFEAGGAEVVRLVRGRRRMRGRFRGTRWATVRRRPRCPGFDAVIHLAGESVVGRWTQRKKNAIRDSRVRGTREPGCRFGAE